MYESPIVMRFRNQVISYGNVVPIISSGNIYTVIFPNIVIVLIG